MKIYLEQEESYYEAELVSIRTQLMVENAIADIEMQSYYVDRDQDLNHRRKAALELGRLTEEILPPNELRRIINKAKNLQCSSAISSMVL